MAEFTITEAELAERRRRARRRLVGAVALALTAVVVLPMLFDPEPKPLGEEVEILIPAQDTPFPGEAAFLPPPDAAQGAAAPDLALAEPPTALTAPPVAETRATPPAAEARAMPPVAERPPHRPPPAAPPPSPSKPAPAVSAPAPSIAARQAPAEPAPVAERPPHRPPPAAPPPPPPPPAAPSQPPKPAAATAPAVPPSPQEPARLMSSAPAEYFLQLGVFANEANARQLVAQAEAAGYRAHLLSQGGQHRVRVGPFEQRGEALEAQARLKAKGLVSVLIAPQ